MPTRSRCLCLSHLPQPIHLLALRYSANGTNIRTSRKIERMYLVAMSRKPRAEELARLVPYIEGGGPSGDPRKALADVFCALLNSSEFAVNH